VAFGGDAVRFAEFQQRVDGRAAVDERTVLGEARLAGFDFEIGPVEGDYGEVEDVGEERLVGLVLAGALELAVDEGVAAEVEVVPLEGESHLGAGDLGALGVGDGEGGGALAVEFDAVFDAGVDLGVGREEVAGELLDGVVHGGLGAPGD